MNPNNNINIGNTVKLANANGGFTGANDAKVRQLPSNPFVSIGWIVFAISSLLSLGLFFYDRLLTINSARTLQEVVGYKDAVKDVDLSGIRALMDKIGSFNEVAKKHNRPTTMLNFLEVITNKNVVWLSFDYKVKDKDKYEVGITGKTLAYKYVIQQMDELQSGKYDKYIKNVSLVNLSKVQEQKIKFNTNSSATNDTRDIVNFSIRFEVINPAQVEAFDQYIEGNANNINKIKSIQSTSTRASSTLSSSSEEQIEKELNKMLSSSTVGTVKNINTATNTKVIKYKK